MYRVNILASENSVFSTVCGPMEIFLQAGVFWNHINAETYDQKFIVKLTTFDGKPITNMTGATLTPHLGIQASDKYDLLLIPSEGLQINNDAEQYQIRIEYIKEMFEKGTLIASACTGAFLLGEAGILNGKTATTHWAMAKQFKSDFPDVNLNTDLLIADSGNVITSGGVTADLDLSMYIIKKLCGPEIALQTTRCTLVSFSHKEQKEFKTFIAEKQHGDETILKCQNYIEKKLSIDLTISELAKKFGLSTRTFNRRFKSATDETAVQYIQKLKLEKAKWFLEQENSSFESIAIRLGYENISYFRRMFKKYTGLSPKEYRGRYFFFGPN